MVVVVLMGCFVLGSFIRYVIFTLLLPSLSSSLLAMTALPLLVSIMLMGVEVVILMMRAATRQGRLSADNSPQLKDARNPQSPI